MSAAMITHCSPDSGCVTGILYKVLTGHFATVSHACCNRYFKALFSALQQTHCASRFVVVVEGFQCMQGCFNVSILHGTVTRTTESVMYACNSRACVTHEGPRFVVSAEGLS